MAKRHEWEIRSTHILRMSDLYFHSLVQLDWNSEYTYWLNCMVASIVTYRIPQGVLVDERFAGWQVIFCVPILHSW